MCSCSFTEEVTEALPAAGGAPPLPLDELDLTPRTREGRVAARRAASLMGGEVLMGGSRSMFDSTRMPGHRLQGGRAAPLNRDG